MERKCFRPLAGIMVLILLLFYAIPMYVLCFRPLAGIMVLIITGSHVSVLWYEFVSVPLRGLWFLSRRK